MMTADEIAMELAQMVALRCPAAYLASRGVKARGTLDEEAAAVIEDVRERLREARGDGR